MRRVVWLLSFMTVLGASTYGFAQDEAEDEESPAAGSDDEAEASPEASPSGDAEAGPDQATKPDAAASGAAPTWWIGPYIEGVIVPSFMLKLFLDASPTVFTPSFGLTITHRNADGFSWVLGLGYASYGFAGPFRATGDPEADTEYLDSSLGLLHARGMLLWSTEITHGLSFEYGIGIELGVVLGSLIRNEAYKDASGNYHACAAPNNPDPIYCELPTNPPPGELSNRYNMFGAHYGVKEERVPPVAAALMIPALALRFTPIEKLAIKVEAAFGLLQFTFGLSAAYAIGE
jgi:hypothetical protein